MFDRAIAKSEVLRTSGRLRDGMSEAELAALRRELAHLVGSAEGGGASTQPAATLWRRASDLRNEASALCQCSAWNRARSRQLRERTARLKLDRPAGGLIYLERS